MEQAISKPGSGESLEIDRIRTDGGTQPRAGLVEKQVIEYAEMMADGSEMDPLLVYNDGNSYWLVDGFHRITAAQRIGLKSIRCEIRQGTQSDAQWASCGVNGKHGIPRSPEDRRRAVLNAIAHPRSRGLSDRAIAIHCHVGNRLVGDVRRENPQVCPDTPESRIGRDGKKYPAQRAKRTPAPAATPDPRWPVPNRFGIYAEDNAIEVPHEYEGGKLCLRALRVGEAAWIYTFSGEVSTAGSAGVFSADCVPEQRYEDAIGAAATQAAEWVRELRAMSTTTNKTRRVIGPLLAWLCTMGAPPDVHESGPIDEPADEADSVIKAAQPGTAIWRNLQEIREMRAGMAPKSRTLSPDAVELQRAITFLNQPLNWQSVAAELGMTEALRAQMLKGRGVLDAILQRAVKQLSA